MESCRGDNFLLLLLDLCAHFYEIRVDTLLFHQPIRCENNAMRIFPRFITGNGVCLWQPIMISALFLYANHVLFILSCDWPRYIKHLW